MTTIENHHGDKIIEQLKTTDHKKHASLMQQQLQAHDTRVKDTKSFVFQTACPCEMKESVKYL